MSDIGGGQFSPDDLRVFDRFQDRAPWDEGKPISAEEVETLRVEFEQFRERVKGSPVLEAWLYLGGVRALRILSRPA